MFTAEHVGQTVYSIFFGTGIITNFNNNSLYPVEVTLNNKHKLLAYFYRDGRCCINTDNSRHNISLSRFNIKWT